jgi:site-specific recombinase XerD
MAKELVKTGNTAAAMPRTLAPAQYGDLAEVPPELEWLANLTNPKTREAYRIDVCEFSVFAGLCGPAEFRTVTRAHVIAWRKHLEMRGLADSTIRRKLSALSSLFNYIVRKYGRATGIDAQVNGLCVHSVRATAATNALDNKADIAKAQEWLGHANVSTTRLYDRRKTRPEDSPTFRVRY